MIREGDIELQLFHIGDRVKYIGRFPYYTERHIITEVTFDGEWQYATNRGAWFGNKDFELIEAANTSTLMELLNDSPTT